MKKTKKEQIKRLKKKLKELRSVINWCLAQDWSYGNHGPEGVAGKLWESINGKI